MHGRGMCAARGCVWQVCVCVVGGMHGGRVYMAGETAPAADGTHPTGMHSCFYRSFVTVRYVYFESYIVGHFFGKNLTLSNCSSCVCLVSSHKQLRFS